MGEEATSSGRQEALGELTILLDLAIGLMLVGVLVAALYRSRLSPPGVVQVRGG